MYVGGGQMIEAPETGQVVHITPVRTDDDFAGVGVV
jgi:cell wall-associated NlpC family hydrolase